MPSAVVTGGSRGIGRATAVALARDGFDVAFCYRQDAAAAAETAERIEAHGRRALHRALDVADLAEMQDFVATAEAELGPIDAAVAGAGITRDRTMALMTGTDWSLVLRTNLDGAFNLARSVIVGMLKRRAGAVVLVSSVAGIGGQAGQTNYAASKSGMHGLGRSLAKEVGSRGVRVNVVAPGFIETDMVAGLGDAARAAARRSIPLGRFGHPEHVADVVSFLLSPRAEYVTGTVVRVDGGISL